MAVKGKEFRLFVTNDMHQKLKMLSAIEGKSMNKIITESLGERIENAVKSGKLHIPERV